MSATAAANLELTHGGQGRLMEILKARARALARRADDPSTVGGTLNVVEFRLAREHYAFEREFVREVCPLTELTPLPCTPAFIAGIVNVRSRILPVIDIRKFFDLPEAGITDAHMVVIVHAAGLEAGILADAVVGARSVPLEAIQASLPTLTGIRAQYLRGVADGRTAILDAPRILSDPNIVVEQETQP